MWWLKVSLVFASLIANSIVSATIVNAWCLTVKRKSGGPLARKAATLFKKIKWREKIFGNTTSQSQACYDIADFSDVLVLSLGAGRTLPAAFGEAAAGLGKTSFGEDVGRVLLYYQAGESFSRALQLGRLQTKSEKFRQLVDTIVLGLTMGTDIVDSLESLCSGLRSSASASIEEYAARAPVKMLFPMVCFIFPSIFILLGAPVVRDLMEAVS